MDEDLTWEYLKKPQFRLATMNGRAREMMFEAMIHDNDITGGWFWHACFPGCLPDGCANGPFPSHAEALADAQSECVREAMENAPEDYDPADDAH